MVTSSRRRDVVKQEIKDARIAKMREQVSMAQSLSLRLDNGARPTANIPPKLSFLIICEGKKTEPDYINALKEAWRLVADVKAVGVGQAPHKLLKVAMNLRNKKEYDRVWIVFDKDDFQDSDIRETFVQAKKEKIRVAFSNESFELWLLMHFQNYGLAQGRQGVTESLSEHLHNYNKELKPAHLELLIPRIGDAVKHAKLLFSNTSKNKGIPLLPFTAVHLLVQDLTTSSSRLPSIQEKIKLMFPDNVVSDKS